LPADCSAGNRYSITRVGNGEQVVRHGQAERFRRFEVAATAAAIEHGDWASLCPDQACGCLAVAGLLVEAGRRGFKAPRVSVASVFTVHPSVSARTVPEFIAYAKANPGKIDMATNGNGSTSHISAELFKMMTGVKMVNIPYRGTAPAITALLGGQVQGSFVSLPGSIAYIKAGRLRAIAVTTAMRSEALPDIPTVAEFVPGYEASVWYGIGAPAKTPSEIVDKLNKEVNAALADPKMKALFADLGGTSIAGSPADFGTLITDETEKWGKVIRAANIKAE
jgi:tripartite-type tricarboxylate transporter receptor subunit TctC